jgi:hypothetical protein
LREWANVISKALNTAARGVHAGASAAQPSTPTCAHAVLAGANAAGPSVLQGISAHSRGGVARGINGALPIVRAHNADAEICGCSRVSAIGGDVAPPVCRRPGRKRHAADGYPLAIFVRGVPQDVGPTCCTHPAFLSRPSDPKKRPQSRGQRGRPTFAHAALAGAVAAFRPVCLGRPWEAPPRGGVTRAVISLALPVQLVARGAGAQVCVGGFGGAGVDCANGCMLFEGFERSRARGPCRRQRGTAIDPHLCTRRPGRSRRCRACHLPRAALRRTRLWRGCICRARPHILPTGRT